MHIQFYKFRVFVLAYQCRCVITTLVFVHTRFCVKIQIDLLRAQILCGKTGKMSVQMYTPSYSATFRPLSSGLRLCGMFQMFACLQTLALCS